MKQCGAERKSLGENAEDMTGMLIQRACQSGMQKDTVPSVKPHTYFSYSVWPHPRAQGHLLSCHWYPVSCGVPQLVAGMDNSHGLGCSEHLFFFFFWRWQWPEQILFIAVA